MNTEENPYASPLPLESHVASESPLMATHVFLVSFLGLQAGGMIGLFSACLAPLRYLLGPVPLDAVFMEDLSSNVRVQILGESILILVTCLILGATFGAVLEIGENCIFSRPVSGKWFLLSSLKLHRISLRGLAFAIVGSAPTMIILIASYSRKDAFFWLHGLWAIAHLLIAIYFGERFAEACCFAKSAGSTDLQRSST